MSATRALADASSSLPALPLLGGRPFCRTHKRYAPAGRTTCLLCESELEVAIAARNPIATPTYSGPDRRRQDLLECGECKRRLRLKYFSDISDTRSERPGLCDDCRTRAAQRAAEIRAQRPASQAEPQSRRGRITEVVRDKDENIARIVRTDESGRTTVEEVVDVGGERAAAAERDSLEQQQGGVEREHKVFHTRQEGDKTILEGADITRWRTTDDLVPRRVLKEQASRSAQATVDEFFKRHPVVPLGPTPTGMTAAAYIKAVRAAVAAEASLRGAEYVLLRLPERDTEEPSTAEVADWGPLLGWITQFLSTHPRARIAQVPAGEDAAAYIKSLIADGDEWTSFRRSESEPEYVVF